ncbi:M48 family metalloprotease [Actinospica durhamensis]|uniref:M48 family metalloprotease n=1 Tax=Actinospica durhamensis TaxID=1508375 RepID=A0A941IQQ3_9ACTN|nr:M48 family metallopeptidase [Actinospica durhamensis]MBR7834477.1 M48 family metalloprotease [Actinospica durhamensis]
MDARFIRWCLRCADGADPYPPERTGRQQRRLAREAQRSVELFATLQTAKNLRPSSALGVWVKVFSLIVHLVGVLVVAAPVFWLVSGGPAGLAWATIVFACVTFLAVRPRVPRRLKADYGFGREDAPHLYALLDRCAAQLGCRTPDRVAVGPQFNASTGRAGLAQRSYLRIGAPLWTVLTGPERVALLGHELGHQVNGDSTRSLLALSAHGSLTEWTRLLHPRQDSGERRTTRRMMYTRSRFGSAGLAALLTPIVMAVVFLPFFAVAVGCQSALERLALLCGQRAEYLADELGARLAGTDASLGLCTKLTLGPSCTAFLGARRLAKSKAKPDPSTLWADFRGYVESMPDTEIQRRLIVDRVHNTRTDRTHPAGHLRLALLRERPQLPGTLRVTDAEWAAIDAELASRMTAAARIAQR